MSGPEFRHSNGDDPRAWNYGTYYVEANVTQEQWGTIPGPHDPVFNGTMGTALFPGPMSTVLAGLGWAGMRGGMCRRRALSSPARALQFADMVLI